MGDGHTEHVRLDPEFSRRCFKVRLAILAVRRTQRTRYDLAKFSLGVPNWWAIHGCLPRSEFNGA
jgi:hypothetical protein